MNIHDDIIAAGGTLIRSKRHNVYILPNGARFTAAQTASDYRAYRNQLSDLRRVLGQTPAHQEGQRREKRNKPGRVGHEWRAKPVEKKATMAEQLRKSLGGENDHRR